MTKPVDYRHVSILWAEPERAGEMAALHATLFAEAWDTASFERLLGHPGSTAFFARLGTPPATVGFILGQIAADETEILSIGVRADHQRHGIARRLVEAMARAARKSEVKRLYLDVAASNTAALGLYKGIGFQQTGTRKGYYARPGSAPEDAITLAWTL